jgi:hypothetical protein
MMDKITVATVKEEDLKTMEEVELAKLCKRSGLYPGSNSRADLVERIREAKSKLKG